MGSPEVDQSSHRFGVDEAGKGPVLGSMFAAAVRADPMTLPEDVDDSKSISADRRESLAGEIHRQAEAVSVVEVTVEQIDDPASDMNSLTVGAHANALSEIPVDGLSGTVDACDTDPDRFGRRIDEHVEADVTIAAEHGADESDPLVGAASIVAKVARDSHVADLSERFGAIGSGYPSDPTTREFLASYVKANGELPECARESWKTCRDLLKAAEQSSLGDFGPC